jgi:uncharacterized membrane protein YwzB
MDGQDQQRPKQGWRRYLRRPSPASLVSIIAHVILGAVVWNAVQMPAVFDRFLQNDERAKPTAERIQFVTVAPSQAAASQPTRTRTRQAPAAAQPSSAPNVVPLVAPAETPRELPAPAATADSVAAGAVRGPLRGGSGSTRGVQPNYDDPRLWVSDLEFYYAPKTYEERLDSALYATLRRHMDSVTANAYSPNKFERGDWTFGKEGSKWGIDQKYIQLGRFKIPTALLALLPLNRMQGNPIAMERDRNAAYMRADIMYHAQAAMNEEQFRKAVAAIRDRKEREKRGRVSAQNPGPMGSPGERPPPN